MSGGPYLTTERLLLRTAEPSDADRALAWLGDPEVMRYIEPPFDRARAEAFLTACGACRPPRIYLLCRREDGEPAGHVIWHPWPGRPGVWELGCVLRRSCWGLGYAREISLALLALAAREGIGRVLLETVPENTASRACIMGLGGVWEGTEAGLQVWSVTPPGPGEAKSGCAAGRPVLK